MNLVISKLIWRSLNACTLAAQREMLGISQPTLSQQIRMLEEAVGAPLINRSNRTMELTAVGRVFAEDAQQILTLMERAKRNAEDILSGEEAEVKLGVCPHHQLRIPY